MHHYNKKGVKVSADKLTTNDVTEKKASESVKIKILSTFLPASAFLPVHAEFRSLCPVALTGTDRYGRSFGAWGAMVVLLRWRRRMRQRSKGMVIGRGLRRKKITDYWSQSNVTYTKKSGHWACGANSQSGDWPSHTDHHKENTYGYQGKCLTLVGGAVEDWFTILVQPVGRVLGQPLAGVAPFHGRHGAKI